MSPRATVVGVARAAEAGRLEAMGLLALDAPGAFVLAALRAPAGRDERLDAACAASGALSAFAPLAEASPEAARRWIAARTARFDAVLTRLAGAVELVLTWTDAAPPATPSGAGGGAAWLRARAATQRRRDAAAEIAERRARSAVALTAPAAADLAARPFQGDLPGLDVALLLPRGEATICARRLAGGLGAEWCVSGPWPPYTFCARYLPE